MLCSLHIENFAIIDKLEVEFGPGLNILTGETGAGKTIVVQALNLVLGDRASSDLIRTGCDRASVTAVFSIPLLCKEGTGEVDPAYPPQPSLTKGGGELIIHRVVSTTGKGKITINGIPATQQMLKEAAERLVDMSSQHEHQQLLNDATHINIVDQFGGYESLAGSYRDAHNQYINIRDDLQRLRASEKEAKDRLEFMKFQLQELKNANLKIKEDEDLEAERSRIKHAVQLEAKMKEAEGILYESAGSACELLGNVEQSLASCAQIDSSVAAWKEAVSNATSSLADVARDIKRYTEKLNSDPGRLEEIDDRIHLIKNLKRKHGGTIEGCIERLHSLEEEVRQVERFDDIIAEKEKLQEAARVARKRVAEDLTKKRKDAAIKLSAAIEKETQSLGFKKLQFVVNVARLPEEEWGAEGAERIEFLISPNVGEMPKPLSRIASGGELSRIMLAVKRALTDRAATASTSVFDEVDSGIGGATAEVVGKKLFEVAKSRQVICITHLPQIASFGENHFVVAKKVAKGRTVASVERLSGDRRTEELARMLGGTEITETTRKHAEEMLKRKT